MHIVACVYSSIFIAITLWSGCRQFVYSPIGECLNCFQSLAIMNKIVINMRISVALYAWQCLVISIFKILEILVRVQWNLLMFQFTFP